MVEYVIHGTYFDNIFHILESGKLETNPQNASKNYYGKGQNPKQIFTNILLRDLPNQEKQVAYWGDVGIVLDKRILKAKKWYATLISSFLDKFDDAFEDNDETRNLILSKNQKANASRIPSIARLKNIIINLIKQHSDKNSFGNLAFTHSHELLFGEDISLAEYGICILVQERLFNKILNKTQQDKIKELCNDLGIHLIVYKPMIPGINKIIDLINTIRK